MGSIVCHLILSGKRDIKALGVMCSNMRGGVSGWELLKKRVATYGFLPKTMPGR